jgi:hypothetical protein
VTLAIFKNKILMLSWKEKKWSIDEVRFCVIPTAHVNRPYGYEYSEEALVSQNCKNIGWKKNQNALLFVKGPNPQCFIVQAHGPFDIKLFCP